MKTWGEEKEFWGLNWSYDPQWILNEEQREIQRKLIECCRTVVRPNAVSVIIKIMSFAPSSLSTLIKLTLRVQGRDLESPLPLLD